MTTHNNFSELKKAIHGSLAKIIENKTNDLLENHSEDYYRGEDREYYHNGVGFATCASEPIYDENQALDDAKEQIFDDIKNNDCNEDLYNIYEDIIFNPAANRELIDFLRTLI